LYALEDVLISGMGGFMSSHMGNPFESLPLPRKEMTVTAASRYRIYDNVDHFTTVTANTALEAIQSSGLKKVYKIQRDRLDDVNILEMEFWKREDTQKQEQAAPQAGETPAAAEPPPSETAAPSS
jgi:hypothetical protein